MGSTRKKKIPARVVEDEEYQLTHERSCGIDIAKDKGDIAVRLPPARDGGRRVTRTWILETTWANITELAAELLEEEIGIVVMEATSDYWRSWFYLLEACGLNVQLVNPSMAKQLAGRPKTDRLDCQWLARLAEMGLLLPSFVPPPEVRALRALTRSRLQCTRERTRHWQQLEKILEDALVRVSSAFGKMAGNQSAWRILQAICEGEHNPDVLAALAHHAVKGGRDGIRAHLEGMMPGPHHIEIIRSHMRVITMLDRETRRFDDLIAAQMESMQDAWGVTADGTPSPDPGPDPAVMTAAARLAEIPGISLQLAIGIIAETGLDMTRFPTANHLASWAGLSPVARQSGKRTGKGKKGNGNAYLKGYCGQAALGASRTQTFPGARYRHLAKRIGAAKAQVAVARTLLLIVWHLLADPSDRYRELGPDWHLQHADIQRRLNNTRRQWNSLGYDITITPAASSTTTTNAA